MMNVIALEDGPFVISGQMVLAVEGKEEQVEGKVALCRCGTSQNKPYCDGAHKGSGFKAASLELMSGSIVTGEACGCDCDCDCSVEAGQEASATRVLP